MTQPIAVEIENVKWSKASAEEADRLNYYSNHDTKVPKIYTYFGFSGIYLLGFVLMLGAWIPVFIKEVSLYALPILQLLWRISLIYTIIALALYGGIVYWYRHKTVAYFVTYATCSDINWTDDDRQLLTFVTENNERFTIFRDELAYVPESLSVFVDYVVATERLTNQYMIYSTEGVVYGEER